MSIVQEELKNIDAKIKELKQKRFLIKQISEEYGEDVFDFKSNNLLLYKSLEDYISYLPFKKNKLLNEKILKDAKHEAIVLKDKSRFELEKVSVVSYIEINNNKVLVNLNNVGYVFRDQDYNSYNINIEEYPKNVINENIIFQAFMQDVLDINSTERNTLKVSGFNTEPFEEKLKLLIFK